jgi:hypothetical protein
VEKALVWDIANLIWEDMRWRRLTPSLLMATAYQGVEKILQPLVDCTHAEVLARRWALRDEGAVNEFDEILAGTEQTLDAVMAQTLLIHLDAIVRIDELSASAQMRLKLTLRELERRRAMSGPELKLIEAKEVETSPAE